MEGIKNEINAMLNSIDETTTLFYQQKKEEGYLQLENTLTLLINGINHIYQYGQEGNAIGIDETQINKVLTDAMNAMEEKDTVLLSDILQYDLKGLLEDLFKTIG